MRKDWIWALGLGVAVVACLEDKGGDSGGSDGSDGSGADGSGADGSADEGGGTDEGGGGGTDGTEEGGGGTDGSDSSSGTITALAEAVCGMYDDCGIMEYYFGDMATCVDTVASYYESYGCTPGSTFDECISEIEAGGCDYYYYGGSGSCYYALECSGGYYYYYYYYYYY